MNTNVIILVVVVVAVGLWVWSKGRAAQAARGHIEAGALVIDVRSKGEFDGGHLASAKHVPVETVAQKAKQIEKWAGGKDKPIVVYCASGARSGRALRVLHAAGFTNVHNGGGYAQLR